MPNPKIVVPFTLTADQVNALDGTAVNLFSFVDSTSSLVRVPVRLEINKAAGTRYDITRNFGGQNLYDDTLGSNFSRSVKPGEGSARLATFNSRPEALALKDSNVEAEAAQGEESFLYIRDNKSRVLFKVPAVPFLQSTLATGFVVFPFLDGKAFRSDRNVFSLIANCGIANGTGAVTGNLYFEEYAGINQVTV